MVSAISAHPASINRGQAAFLLSVVIPVYNEASTLRRVIERVRRCGLPCEIVLVDDGSTDGTSDVLDWIGAQPWLRTFRHRSNRGKGAALRTGFVQTRGDIVIVQDADLEYHPREFHRLIQPILDGRADVVYGTRFWPNGRRLSNSLHEMGNRLVTYLSNLSTGLALTDVETCYKAIRKELIEDIAPWLRENRFGVELEITAKLARRTGVRFCEVPISYRPRTRRAGKKIRWTDAIRAIYCTLKY